MSDLEEIQAKAAERGLEFLLIGGLAVIEHGFARLTTDIDLVIPVNDKERWGTLLRDLQYQLINEKDSFRQYEPATITKWPLDLMLVNAETYAGLVAAALPVTVMGASIRMVSLKHLLALKLHVLKQGKLHRFLDDLEDVIKLVVSNRLI